MITSRIRSKALGVGDGDQLAFEIKGRDFLNTSLALHAGAGGGERRPAPAEWAIRARLR